ncbi:MAG: hypothetical protein JSW04_09095 [Desulfobacterales bacterium]|nr:MAG: hypothetical protein JSW04_09095 [Desulfobacterales bacterium]
MSMKPNHQMAIDTIHHKITAIKAELESFRQHPTLGPWVHSLEAVLPQWKDQLGMMGDHAGYLLSSMVSLLTAYSQGIKDQSPELAKSLEELSKYIEKGINAGLWGVVAEPPLSAQGLDPAEDLDQAQGDSFHRESKLERRANSTVRKSRLPTSPSRKGNVIKEVTKEEFKAIFIKYGKSQRKGEVYWNEVYEPRTKDIMRYFVRLPENSEEDQMMIVDGGNELSLFFMTDDRVEAFFDFPGKNEL